MELRELYQAVIIDHNRHPKNHHAMADATHRAEGFNTLCGDQVTLYLKIEHEKITAVSFEGSGCAIATASASLLTEQILHKTIIESEMLFQEFHQLLTDPTPPTSTALLGKLAVFAGVREFPARVKCATLAWHTLQAALRQQQQPVSTE